VTVIRRSMVHVGCTKLDHQLALGGGRDRRTCCSTGQMCWVPEAPADRPGPHDGAVAHRGVVEGWTAWAPVTLVIQAAPRRRARRCLRDGELAPDTIGVTSHPWFHPVNVYAQHRQALELMVEIFGAAVDDSLPEARRRHPLPEAIPGALLGTLVRDAACDIVLSPAFAGQSLRAARGPNLSLQLWTHDNLLRIRARKAPDPEQRVPQEEQLELDLPDDYASSSLYGQVPELALFWAVKGEALYRVILAASLGWDDEVSLSTWHAAAEVSAPAEPSLAWPPPDRPTGTEPPEDDDLEDLIHLQQEDDKSKEAPGDAS
jgi:hypothetical protein